MQFLAEKDSNWRYVLSWNSMLGGGDIPIGTLDWNPNAGKWQAFIGLEDDEKGLSASNLKDIATLIEMVEKPGGDDDEFEPMEYSVDEVVEEV